MVRRKRAHEARAMEVRRMAPFNNPCSTGSERAFSLSWFAPRRRRCYEPDFRRSGRPMRRWAREVCPAPWVTVVWPCYNGEAKGRGGREQTQTNPMHLTPVE